MTDREYISDNGVSQVYREGDVVYKVQPKFMTDNEIWCLLKLYSSGIVPRASQTAIDTIMLEYIKRTEITDLDLVKTRLARVLRVLKQHGIRHGDLTHYNILVRDNQPYIIDFSEARLACDPRPDKRREPDEFWVQKTIGYYETILGELNDSIPQSAI